MSRSCDRDVITGPALIPNLRPEAAVDYKSSLGKLQYQEKPPLYLHNWIFHVGNGECFWPIGEHIDNHQTIFIPSRLRQRDVVHLELLEKIVGLSKVSGTLKETVTQKYHLTKAEPKFRGRNLTVQICQILAKTNSGNNGFLLCITDWERTCLIPFSANGRMMCFTKKLYLGLTYPENAFPEEFWLTHVGFMNDGKIVGADVTFYTNAGCSPDESILVIIVALVKMDNAYSFPNLNCRGKACKTNLPSNTAFRGFGFPQTGFITETIMDAVATKCGLPPDQVREKNMYKGIGQTHYKQEFDSTNLMRCWNECLHKSSYAKRRNEIQKFNKENYWKKKGIAIIPLKFTVGFVEKMFHQVTTMPETYFRRHIPEATRPEWGLVIKLTAANQLPIPGRRGGLDANYRMEQRCGPERSCVNCRIPWQWPHSDFASPLLWNSLPQHIRLSPTIKTFKMKLKTYLFQQAYNLQ
ncbi:unnamed protein product [Ranitomeya imitator]|uniref:Aldehyde oxidase/xanthine dehydrogenase first molybdopterin binding domain-containing protein n=1 Tax=Ranitomeya imitator TaxID=111125 RepID=A0ABN9MG78_9NEOB|nr:unnamed protein product [Ranitomeya imitator]